MLQSLIVYFVSSFARHEIPDARSGALRYVKIACGYLQENLSANPTIEELAAIVGLSPFHLSREFRRHMGLPPHAYQIHCRIRKAKALLAENRSGHDVAYSLGFADQSHFIRHFKKQVGMTPEAFRKSVRF